MHQGFSIRPQMKIGPGLVIAGKLLRAPGDELEQLILNEVASNPALELAHEPGLGWAARSPSFDELDERIAQRRSPLDRLVDQVSTLGSERDWELVVTLIYSLDRRGFLVQPPEWLAAELGAPPEALERAIQVLRQLDPPGIGAGDTRECFLIQCAHLEEEGKDCRTVHRILTLAWDDFLHQRWPRLARKTGLSKEAVQEAVRFMRLNLYPYPLAIGEALSAGDEVLRAADLVIRRENDAWPGVYTLHLPGAERLELRISAGLQEACEPAYPDGECVSAGDRRWIRDHVERARIVVDAVSHRWGTLRKIGEHLLRTQHEFIERGPLYLKPVTQAMVAIELGLHESTISRAVKDKNVQMPNGQLVPLRAFFDPTLAAKEAIRSLLEGAPSPLCDREIAERLQSQGVSLARRTVAKYRQEMAFQQV